MSRKRGRPEDRIPVGEGIRVSEVGGRGMKVGTGERGRRDRAEQETDMNEGQGCCSLHY